MSRAIGHMDNRFLPKYIFVHFCSIDLVYMNYSRPICWDSKGFCRIECKKLAGGYRRKIRNDLVYDCSILLTFLPHKLEISNDHKDPGWVHHLDLLDYHIDQYRENKNQFRRMDQKTRPQKLRQCSLPTEAASSKQLFG